MFAIFRPSSTTAGGIRRNLGQLEPNMARPRPFLHILARFSASSGVTFQGEWRHTNESCFPARRGSDHDAYDITRVGHWHTINESAHGLHPTPRLTRTQYAALLNERSKIIIVPPPLVAHTPGRKRATRGRLGPKWADSGQTLAESGPHFGDLGRLQPQFGRFRALLGVKCGRVCAPKLADFRV